MIRRALLKDPVRVRTFAGGEGHDGPVHNEPRTIKVNVDSKRRLVRSASGDETVSELTLQVHPQDEACFPPESLVTWRGRTSQVIDSKPHTRRGRVVWVEVSCG